MNMPTKKEAYLIASAWEQFRKRFIPAAASEREVEQYRRTFYSGAWSFGAVLMLVAEDQLDKEKGAQMTAGMMVELVDFYRELGTDPR